MAIFSKRPLAAACLMLILSAAAGYLLPHAAVWSIVLSAVALSGLLLLSCLWRPLGRGRMLLLLLSVGILLGGGRTLFSAYQRDLPLQQLIGEDVTAEVSVLEVRHSNTYSATLLVEIHTVNGEPATGKAMLSCAHATPFYEGDRFRGSFRAESLGYDEFYRDNEFLNRADGCSITLVSESATGMELLANGKSGFASRMRGIQLRFSRALTDLVGGEEGNLLSALLLGDKEGLGADTVRNFKRAGISHLLALSGLHLGILTLILDRFLMGLGVGKRLRICTVFAVLLGYLLLTGCSFSMLRAVIMLGMVYLAFLLREDADAMTTLLVAGAAIVLCTPYAVFSLSYQMTMLATFGILSFERIQHLLRQLLPRRKGIVGLPVSILRILLGSLFLSVSAAVAVLPVQWLAFGECSLMSPLANLLFVPLATPLLVLGLLTLFAFPPQVFARAAKALARFLLWGVELLARTDCMVSLRQDFVPYLLLPFFVVLIVLLLIDLKDRLWIMPAALGGFICAFALAFTLHGTLAAGEVEMIYRSGGKNEGVLLYGTQGAVICDISNGSATQLRHDWNLLQEAGATEVDVLLLTHYHKEHAIALRRFGKSVYIKELWVPQPVTTADAEVLTQLSELCDALKIRLFVYRFDSDMTLFSDGILTVAQPLYEKRSTQPTVELRFSYGNREVHYVSAALSEYLRNRGEAPPAAKSDLFVLGVHGPVPHAAIAFSHENEDETTVLVANEDILGLLVINDTCEYVYAPNEYHFYFKD